MTTPEQLNRWRDEVETAWLNDSSILKHEGAYAAYIKGYLRARRENKQGLKDVRNQALAEALAICNATCDPYNTEHGNGYNRGALDCENKIKELLK